MLMSNCLCFLKTWRLYCIKITLAYAVRKILSLFRLLQISVFCNDQLKSHIKALACNKSRYFHAIVKQLSHRMGILLSHGAC